MLNPLSVIKHPVLLSFYFISSLAHAQNFSSASTAAVGGAGRAAVEAGDVNYLNPAGLVHLKGRSVFATYSKEDLFLGLSESSREVMVPASLSYFQRKTKDTLGRELRWQETRLSIADFVTSRFSMGVTAIMSSVKFNDSSYDQSDGNLGFFYTPTDKFGIAAVFYHVFSGSEKVPEEVRFKPETAFGLNYIYQNFLRLRGDVKSGASNNFGKPTYMMGLESLLNEWVVFRLGYQHNILASQELVTTGFGFNGPVFSANYSYQGTLKGANFDRHSIDLSFSF